MLHPFTQGEKLGRLGQDGPIPPRFTTPAITWRAFLGCGEDLDHSLSRDGEILGLELLLVILHHEVVGTELRGGYQLAVAVQELDWDVDAVLGEE